MPTPYERIDVLEGHVRDLLARVEKLEKAQQQGAVYGGPADKAVPGSTLHLPAKAKH
jgi:hypothetical protein